MDLPRFGGTGSYNKTVARCANCRCDSGNPHVADVIVWPHLLQSFRMEPGEGPDVWWSFTCKGYKCDYRLEKKGALSPELQGWSQAGKL